ncbi:S-type pyocin domain-containing protein [Serratia sp. NA_112.1]|uniref:S-type pyocin domain-containing protein n=1 Tax=Serratia sp. NA_112.1 TaxID=3415665 RepID=UPI004046D598
MAEEKENNQINSKPLYVYLGNGKFLFNSQTKACYLAKIGSSWSWVMDRGDKNGVAACMAIPKEIAAALSTLTGAMACPVFTPDSLAAAEAALRAPGTMMLGRYPGMVQLSVAGSGVVEGSDSLLKFLARCWAELRRIATVNTLGSGFGVLVMGFWPRDVGLDSDRVPGRDVPVLFSYPVSAVVGGSPGLQPGADSVEMPVRGRLVMENGHLALQLLSTGNSGVPKAVQVLTPVRDQASGLDRITVPAVAGAPSRTILINPAPVKPPTPPTTGNPAPVPTTPVHTGTVIKPVENIVTTTTPVAEWDGFQDFIYWQPNASGTGVEAIYVMLSEPLDSGRFTRKQLDKKFKHASDFGIADTKKNRVTLTQYRDAVEAHLKDRDTVEKGTYRREKGSKVFFNTKTNNVVVLDKDGEFVSGWNLIPGSPQYNGYINTGVL